MYIETRTSVDEVIADVLIELRFAINGVRADVRTRQDHPTYISKSRMRERMHELNGAYAFAARILGGMGEMPESVINLMAEVRVQVANELERK